MALSSLQLLLLFLLRWSLEEFVLVLPATAFSDLLRRPLLDREIVHVDFLQRLAAFLFNLKELIIPIGEIALITQHLISFFTNCLAELARLHLVEHLGKLMNFQDHDIRVELMELLDCELQVAGTIVDLVQSLLLIDCHLTTLPEVLLSLLVHVKKRLQFDIEIGMI